MPSLFRSEKGLKRTVLVKLFLSGSFLALGQHNCDQLLEKSKAELNKGNDSTALWAANEAKILATQYNQPSCLAWSHHRLANAFLIIGDDISSENNYETAIELATIQGDENLLVKSLSALSYLRIDQNAYADAEELNARALQIAQELGDSNVIFDCYVNFGLIDLYEERNQDALNHFLQARSIAMSRGISIQTAAIYQNISTAYLELKDFEEAEKNCLEAIKYCRLEGQDAPLLDCLKLMAYIFLESGSIESAQKAKDNYYKQLSVPGFETDPYEGGFLSDYSDLVDSIRVIAHQKHMAEIRQDQQSLIQSVKLWGSLAVIFLVGLLLLAWRFTARLKKKNTALLDQLTHAKAVNEAEKQHIQQLTEKVIQLEKESADSENPMYRKALKEKILEQISPTHGANKGKYALLYILCFYDYPNIVMASELGLDDSTVSRHVTKVKKMLDTDSLKFHAYSIGVNKLKDKEVFEIFGFDPRNRKKFDS